MTHLLSIFLGRLPIGWLQLWHNRTRLFAAVGGVMFANVLIFMQMGFMNALFDSSVAQHRRFDADLIVIGSDFRSLGLANPFPRSRMLQAATHPAIAETVPVYVGIVRWTDPETGNTTQFRVIGMSPDRSVINVDEIQDQIPKLISADRALLDTATRQLNKELVQRAEAGKPITLELNGVQIHVAGTFRQGASFETDGSLLVSDDTFMRIFPQSNLGAPTLALLRCDPTSIPAEETEFDREQRLAKIAGQIDGFFPERDAQAMTIREFVAQEHDFQGKQKPVGFLFMFGVIMGLVVGVVIVYQVLATGVQDHLKEYATFKAMGYSPRFFSGTVLEEAITLAVLGFIPALGAALILYRIAAKVTSLPIQMTLTRPIFVLSLTIAMCTVSGLIAMRRLRTADPADLF